MKFSNSSVSFLIFILASCSNAFTFNNPQPCCKITLTQSSIENEKTRNPNDFDIVNHVMKTIASTTALSLLTFAPPAIAFVPPHQVSTDITTITHSHFSSSIMSTSAPSSFSSSSLEISESIKTLDMELPSYNKISTATSSQDDIDKQEVNMKSQPVKKKSTAPKEKKSSFSFSSGSDSESSSGLSAEAKKAKTEALKAEKEQKLEEKRALQAQKEKDLEEKKSEKIVIVDMDMPSYSSSSEASGVKKGLF